MDINCRAAVAPAAARFSGGLAPVEHGARLGGQGVGARARRYFFFGMKMATRA